MRKWMLWVMTIALLLAAILFLMWAVQTAWLGSFPGKDKQRYAMWAALELAAAAMCLLTVIALWLRQWMRKKDERRPTELQ
jgi:hypothetical protein